MSRIEIEELGEGLINVYAKQYNIGSIQSIDIEHFITQFLSLKIEYVSFAEKDLGKIGFLSDGETSLLVYQQNRVVPYVFPKNTIVIDKFLLNAKEQGRRRFTLAHEAAHHVLGKMQSVSNAGRFHNEYDNQNSYSREELIQMFNANEWQADSMAASLLMPSCVVENALAKFNQSNLIKIYGDNTLTIRDKSLIKRMANFIGVSYTALFIRLRNTNWIRQLMKLYSCIIMLMNSSGT